MDFEVILSGKEKVQILDNGFRLKWNKEPQGPYNTSYFVCVAPGCDFVYVHNDCEQAIINSVKYVFPNAEIKLCRFYIVDAIRRHANSQGLRRIIKDRSDFRQL